jgi:RNA polymerase sigma-70 factor (ECF subfamily)
MPGLVGDLPAGSRAVLTLHYLDDLPLTEVADVLGLPVGTVKSRLSYGPRLLRERLNIDE